MNDGHRRVAEEVRRLSTELPLALAESLASALGHLDSAHPAAIHAAVQAALPQPHYRAMALELLNAWREHAPELPSSALAFALLVAGTSEEFHRKNEELQLVWTGPEVVAEAARRGVAVRLVLENPEVSAGKVAFDAMQAFGPNVAERSTVYVWPLDRRPKSTSGQHGSLHAKCAVADAKRLLISSANLTEHAFTLNIELGVLVKGGPVPGRVQSYVDSLVASSVLQRVG